MKKYVIALIVLIAVIFLVYEGLIYYDNNFPYGRMWETPAVRPLEDRPLHMDSGLVPISGGEAFYRAALGVVIDSPLLKGDPAVIQQGKVLYFTYCAQCHGKNLDGNGTVGQSFHPLPTDLRSLKVQNLPEGDMFKSISYGILNGRQPPLATTVDILDRWRIIAFIKSLGPRK